MSSREYLFVALGTQREMHVRHFVVCGFSDCTIFSTLSHKPHVFFEKKKLLNIKSVFSLSV